MKHAEKKYLLSSDEIDKLLRTKRSTSSIQHARINHPNAAKAQIVKERMVSILNDPTVDIHDKILKNESLTQQYLGNLRKALTIPKTEAVLGSAPPTHPDEAFSRGDDLLDLNAKDPPPITNLLTDEDIRELEGPPPDAMRMMDLYATPYETPVSSVRGSYYTPSTEVNRDHSTPKTPSENYQFTGKQGRALHHSTPQSSRISTIPRTIQYRKPARPAAENKNKFARINGRLTHQTTPPPRRMKLDATFADTINVLPQSARSRVINDVKKLHRSGRVNWNTSTGQISLDGSPLDTTISNLALDLGSGKRSFVDVGDYNALQRTLDEISDEESDDD